MYLAARLLTYLPPLSKNGGTQTLTRVKGAVPRFKYFFEIRLFFCKNQTLVKGSTFQFFLFKFNLCLYSRHFFVKNTSLPIMESPRSGELLWLWCGERVGFAVVMSEGSTLEMPNHLYFGTLCSSVSATAKKRRKKHNGRA